MKIYPVTANFSNKKFLNYNNLPNNNEPQEQKNYNSIIPQFNDNLMFTARVDKGRNRFYEKNRDLMPVTVKAYYEEHPEETDISPLEAQRKAYEYLTLATTVDDIKEIYPEFKNIRNPEDTKATLGLLYSARENAELLALMDAGILKSKENLSLYLAKKIYLDNKTFEEINKDLESDLNEDFKADFRHRNGDDAVYIRPKTIESLGIEIPEFEYRTSLRYTQNGYSDWIGERISAFWAKLPPEKRTSRAKKTVEKFENWWEKLPHQRKLEMIADQINEIEMLEKYKAEHNGEGKRTYNPQKSEQTDNGQPKVKTKVGSQKLSQDDLFKIWAANNLKIFEAGLSDDDYETVKAIRTEKLIQRWQQMSPAQKTKYLNDLRTGQEHLKFAMIDAWNNSFDIIVALSEHLKKHQIYRPENVIYSSEAFKDFQSKVMTEFWANNPEFGRELGDHIIHSLGKVRRAMKNGTFEELKKEIIRDQKKRIKELQKIKFEKAQQKGNLQDENEIPVYMQKFLKAYYTTLYSQIKTEPTSYLTEYFKIIQKSFSPEMINSWTKNLRGEPLTEQDIKNLEHIKKTEPPEAAYINRPFELVGAEILYELTENPIVYSLSFSDIKVALTQIDRGDKNIDIISTKLGNRRITIPMNNHHINMKEFENLYKMFRKPISEGMVKDLAEEYFDSKDGDYTSLVNYLKTYGQGLGVILLDTSFHSRKNLLIRHILNNMPENIADNYTCLVNTPEQQRKENILVQSSEIFFDTHKNIPEIFIDEYLRGINSNLRRDTDFRLTKPSLIIYDKKQTLNNNLKLKILAMESVLADCLYKSTGNNNVYGLELEDLNSLIIKSSAIKKYPETYMIAEILDGKQSSIPITLKRKVIQGNLEAKYKDYMDDINERINSTENPWDIEELICALNPDENNTEKDEILTDKIKKYKIDFS